MRLIQRGSPPVRVYRGFEREIAIMALRGVVASDGKMLPPSGWGKWKATIQFVDRFGHSEVGGQVGSAVS